MEEEVSQAWVPGRTSAKAPHEDMADMVATARELAMMAAATQLVRGQAASDVVACKT